MVYGDMSIEEGAGIEIGGRRSANATMDVLICKKIPGLEMKEPKGQQKWKKS